MDDEIILCAVCARSEIRSKAAEAADLRDFIRTEAELWKAPEFGDLFPKRFCSGTKL
jgi:hypothetical protein